MRIKIISLILIFCMVISFCVFAEVENGLESAISTAKAKLNIPENYTDFYSQIDQNNDSKIFYLSWSGEGNDKQKGGYVSAKVDEKGRIIYYSHYEYGSFEGDYKLSELDYNGAVKIAYDYIKQICPEFAPSVKAVSKKNYMDRNYNSYYIRFNRYENGVPYYSNYIAAAISARSKQITELEVIWDDIDKFPSPQGALPLERAKEIFKEKIGVSLGYYDNKDGKAELLYSANVSGREYVNAFTGEITQTKITSGSFATDWSSSEKYIDYAQNTYTGDEIGASVPIEQLEYIVRNQLEISDSYALGATNLNGDYCSMMFVSSKHGTIDIQIDTKTKEILRYFKSEAQSGERNVSEDKAYKIAKDFIEKLSPKKYSACSQINNTQVKAQFGGYNYCFVFPRLVNGLEYLDNGIVIEVSPSTGEVISYSLIWKQKLFPSAVTEVTKDNVYDELFERVGMELQYIATAKTGVVYPRSAKDIDIKLVYNFTAGKPLFVNAASGKLSDVNANAYVGDLETKYNDTQGHPSQKSIETLVACKFFDESDYFYPDKKITQYEYLLWIYRAVKQYAPLDADYLYNGLIYEYNVITEAERNDNSEITCEDAIKYLIRLLGYTDVAELKDTYQTKFVDEGMISSDLIGYAAIAQGLNIINGNAFTPKRIVTRATAAEIIYNLLTN